MSIKIVVFNNGNQVISDVKEVIIEDKCQAYKLTKPQNVSLKEFKHELLTEEQTSDAVEMVLSAWVPLAKEQTFYVAMNSVISIAEPVDELVKIYKEKVGEIDD
tara:strand:+ start:121 stop:432 length:312 start_codon:yes stop_codon:yes gene_type:complete